MPKSRIHSCIEIPSQWGSWFFCVVLTITSFSGLSQCKEWKWPADKAKAEEKFALFQDAVRGKLYRQAIPHLNWFLANVPDLNSAVYIYGAEIYDALAKTEKDPLRKARYVDSLMTIYDMRVSRCGDAATILSRKAMSFFKYNINGDHPENVLALMDTAFALAGARVMDVMIVPYMETVVVTRIKTKTIDDQDVLSRYDRITEILGTKMKADQNIVTKLKSYQQQVDDLLLKAVKIDCDFVHMHLAPKFDAHPDNLESAKKVLGYLLAGKCEPDLLWLRAASVIFKHEPDFGLAKNLAIQFYKLDSIHKSDFYFHEALKVAPSDADKADIYTYLGSLASRKGERSEARSLFRQAIESDPSKKEAFDKIGDLYYNSFKACSHEKSMADDRTVYLVAYDYYNKAGDQEKMHLAEKAFPSREEIFLMNYSAGQKIHVGCWIDEDTTIRTRD